MSAGRRLYYHLIQVQIGDVIKQSCGCNQFATTTATPVAPGGGVLPGVDLKRLLAQAEEGNKQAFDTLCAHLPYPNKLWDMLSDLPGRASKAMTSAVMGKDRLLTQEALRRKAAALTQELAGIQPTPLERVLVDRIVLCWLHLHLAEVSYAEQMQDLSITQAAFHEHRITAAHNRYLAAMRTLAQVRRLQTPNVQVVNIGGQQLNVAAIAPAQPAMLPKVKVHSAIEHTLIELVCSDPPRGRSR